MTEKAERFIGKVVSIVSWWYRIPEEIRHQIEREVKAAITKYLKKRAGIEDVSE